MPSINHQRGETRRVVNQGRRNWFCRCPGCGNPRRDPYVESRTISEIRADLAWSEALSDFRLGHALVPDPVPLGCLIPGG